MTFCSTTWVSTQAQGRQGGIYCGDPRFNNRREYILGRLPEEERPACRLPAIAVSVLPLRWSSPDEIVIELKDVLQLGVGLAGWGLAAYQYWRNELTERPFAAFNHAAFKRGVGHWRHPYGRR